MEQLKDLKDENLKKLIEKYVEDRLSEFSIRSRSMFDKSVNAQEMLENINKRLKDSEINLIKYLNEKENK